MLSVQSSEEVVFVLNENFLPALARNIGDVFNEPAEGVLL